MSELRSIPVLLTRHLKVVEYFGENRFVLVNFSSICSVTVILLLIILLRTITEYMCHNAISVVFLVLDSHNGGTPQLVQHGY